MPENSEIEKKEKGFLAYFLTWFAWAVLAIAIYVLSIGPVVKLVWTPGANKTPSVRMMQQFYAPLTWVCENNSYAKDFVTWYLQQVWGVR